MSNLQQNIIRLFLIPVMMLTGAVLFAQQKGEYPYPVKKYWKKGNKEYDAGHWTEAEKNYRKALSPREDQPEVLYNLGNVLQQRQQWNEALDTYGRSLELARDKHLKSSIYHNRGNIYMQMKDYQKAVESYKNSLRFEPDNEQTRYNLALAMQNLKQQQKNQKNQQNQQNQQNKNDQKDQKNQQNQKNKGNKGDQKDQKNQQDQKNKPDDQNKDGKNKPDNQKGDQKDKKDQGDQKDKGNNGDQGKQKKDDKAKPENEGKNKSADQKKQDPSTGQGDEQKKGKKGGEAGITPARMQRLLKAMENEEKKTLKKVRFSKVKTKKSKSGKDW